jgi:hypothetical protein
MELAPKLEEEERVALTAPNITEEAKKLIKNKLQSLYPDYDPVTTLPNMFDYNIDAVAKEISEKTNNNNIN